MDDECPQNSTSKLPSATPPPPRDFLLHLESYLAKRDGVDKLLKISRYATKILLLSSSSLPTLSANPRLKAFESSVGVSRKAFRLGKFVQNLNALRRAPSTAPHLALHYLAYGGEGVYYFVEQFVWLIKAGLVPKEYGRRVQLVSAWAELVGYVGSVGLKVGELRRIGEELEKAGVEEEEEEVRRLKEKLFLKQMSVVQDLADALMALADVRDGKGCFTGPLLMASAGLLSALISTHKNWSSC